MVIVFSIYLSLLMHPTPTCFQKGFDKYVIFIDNDQTYRPLAILPETFWQLETYDTVVITDSKKVARIRNGFSLLVPKGELPLTTHIAIIRYSKKRPVDTVYGNNNLTYWSIKGIVYSDRSGILQKELTSYKPKIKP